MVATRWTVAVVTLVAVLVMSWMSGAVNAQGAGAPAPGPASDSADNPAGISWYQAHGWLMWLAFGVFFPLGVFVARYGQYYFSQWFWTHISIQVTGVILSTVAFAIAVNKFDITQWDNTHVKLGLAIMILVWLQPLLAFIRPHRPVWYFVHWLIGTTAILLGWINIFKGLDVYVGDWPSGGQRRVWYILWSIMVAILGFLYLFFDRLPYIRTQSKDPDDIDDKPGRKNVAMTASDENPYKRGLPGVDGPTRESQAGYQV